MATIGLKAGGSNINDDLDNFNFDDFGFDVPEPKDTRHPIMKVMKPVGRGAKDYITNSSNIERFVKAAMPRGYGQAYDLAKGTAGDLKQLYNSAAEEIKPAKNAAKNLIRKALPSLDGKIPKGLKKKLDEFSKAEEQWQSSQGDDRESQLGSLLTSIFEQKSQDQVKQRTDNMDREKIRQGFEQIRHRDTVSQLDAIRIAVESQTQYQNKVAYTVQKKQLELSYRTFWAMAELNKEQKRSNAEVLTELKATRINTGLPDYLKQTNKEKFTELARNKLLDATREKMLGGVKNYFKKFVSNVGEKAVGKLREYSGAATSMGEMADGMGGMSDMPGFNIQDELIAGLMQFPMDWASGKASKKANKYLGKNRALRRGGSKAEYLATTAGDRTQEYLTSDKHNWGKLEGLRTFLAGSLPSTTPDSKMKVDSNDKRHEALPWSRSNSKSIDEVIPGLLARIHREIKIMRTGDESTPLLAYDFNKNRFSTDTKLAADLRTRIGTSKSTNVNKYADSIINKVDRSKTMTPEQRAKARKMLIDKAVKGESIDIKNISKGDNWGGGGDGDAIAGSFNRYLRAKDGKLADNDQSYKRQISMLRDHSDLSTAGGDPRAVIQQMINSGQLEQLQDMGIVNDKNEIDLNVFSQWLSGEGGAPPGTPPVPSTNNNQRPGRRVRRPSPQEGSRRGPGIRQLIPRTNGGDSNQHNPNLQADRSGDTASGGTVERNVQTIADLLASMDQKYTYVSDTNHATLTQMLQYLSDIAAAGQGGGTGGGSGGGSGGGQGGDSAPHSYTSLWEHLKGSGSNAAHRVKVHAKLAKRHASRLWSKYSPTMEKHAKAGLGHAKAGLEFASNKARDLGGKLSGYYGDVVVAGESFPRLRASLLQAGEYRDKITGRVITSLEDITGDVTDASGNVVITMEEFYNSYVTGSVNKRVKELFSKAKSHLEDWKNRLQSAIPQTFQRLKSSVLGMVEKAKALLPPYDVYSKADMKRPLLYANMMRFEMYFSKSTGKVIKHPRDIDGEVIDERGNIVVSEEHIKEGLVDVAGDPVGKGLMRLAMKVGRKVGQAWELMKNAAVGLFGAIGKGLGKVGDHFKNFFAPFADMITNSRKSVDLLQQIHDMLDARLPGKKKVRGDSNGDGVREGSVEDLKRQRDASRAGRAGPGADGADAKAPGGMIGKLLAGIGGLFNKKKDDEVVEEEDDGFGLDDAQSLYDSVKGDGSDADGDSDDDGGGSTTDKAKARKKAAKARLRRMQRRGRPPGRMARLGSGISRVGRGLFNNKVGRGMARMARPLMGAGSSLLRGAGTLGAGAVRLGAGAAGALTGPGKLAQLARWGAFNTDIVSGAGSLAQTGAKLLPRALGAAGAAYSGYSAYNNIKEGNYGAAAADAGMAAGGMALTGGGLAGLAGAGGAVLGGLGTIIASPFLVPALAVAGVGALGYMGYKYLKKTKVTNLSKLRLAQYGVTATDKDGVEKMFGLEAMLEPMAKLKPDGNLYLDEKELEPKEIADLFGISREQDMHIFNLWYKRRFVPVFRAWLSEVRKIDKDGKLGSVESVIPGKDKLRIAEAVVNAVPESYSHMVGWNQGHPKLDYNFEGVKQILEGMRADLMKEREEGGGEKAVVANNTSATSSTAAAAALAEKALTDKANYSAKDKDGKTINTTGMELGDLTEKIKKGEVIISVAVAVPKNLLHENPNTLDALTSIRYKAYGLTHMSADKARMLSALEQFVGDSLTADTETTKLTIGTDQVMQIAGEVFGVPNSSGEHAIRWKQWFNGRFLPVFLLWAGAIRKKTGKKKLSEAHQAFPLEDQVILARAIIGAQGINHEGAKVSIWQILTNPWAESFELNNDADSTASNLEAIRQLSDKVKLGEVTAKAASAKNGTSAANGQTPAGPAKKPGFFARLFGPKPGKGMNATGDTITSEKDAKPLSGIGDAIRFSGGGSGNYTELPTPTGAGWTANRELLIKAATMAGIDPKALITTVAVESSFNPNAAPKNPNLPSSAKGLGQHLDSSWQEDLKLHGKKFGIPNGTTQFDARASALMTASRLRYNGETLQKNLGRAVTVTDMYLAHLMGLGGATKFLKSPQDAIAAEVAPTTAKQHPEYFYEGSKALTVKEVYAKFAQKLAKRPAEFGVTEVDMKSSSAGVASSAIPSTGGPPGAPAPSQGGNAAAGPPAPTSAPKASFATAPAAGSPSLNQPIAMDKGKSATMGTGPAMVVAKGVKYELILQREDSEDDGTYGTLRFPDGTVLNTLELPWKNNEARVSSIPPGVYPCKKKPSAAFGAAYEVQNVSGRSSILIHAGNSAGSADKGMKADSQGCILLGMDRGRKGSQKVITASKAAMQLFYEKMADQAFTLVVRNGKNSVSGEKSMNFDSVRQPAVNATVAPKQEIASQASKTSGFTPQGPRVNMSTGAPSASSTDLPRLSSTPAGFSSTGPSKSDMQQRDATASSVIAPKIDGMASTLLQSLDAQLDSVVVLREILGALKGGSQSEKTPPMAGGKLKPQTSTAVPVPQRREF